MINKNIKSPGTRIFIIITLLFLGIKLPAQPGFPPPWLTFGPPAVIKFGIHFDPLISWFTTQTYDIRNEGAMPGYNFGISYNRYFGPNYSFSSGINIIDAGGRLISNEVTFFELKNFKREIVTVEPGEAIVYRIKYLSVPLGLKLQTNETTYGTLFVDIGLDPKIVIGGRADIPSLNIKGDNALLELRSFNLSCHMMAGIEYPIGNGTEVVVGIGFDNNFLDITKENTNQPWDMVSHKLLSFRLGINF